jgi:hypothetical protein
MKVECWMIFTESEFERGTKLLRKPLTANKSKADAPIRRANLGFRIRKKLKKQTKQGKY